MSTALCTVLVVDDDPEIRECLADVLADHGYNVATASNGKEALEALAHIARPCLILLDLMMPVMNGLDFLRVTRADTSVATIPIVVVSAQPEMAGSVPAEVFLRKPINLSDLLAVASQYCYCGTTT